MASPKILKISVFRGLSSNFISEISVAPSITVTELKGDIERASGIRRAEQRLLTRGETPLRLNDWNRLDEAAFLLKGCTHAEISLMQLPPDFVHDLNNFREGRRSLEFETDLQADREVVMAAIHRNPAQWASVGEGLRTNKEFILEAATLNPNILRYGEERFRNDPGLAKSLVARHPPSIEYFDTGNKRLMLEVVGVHGGALQYASKNLRADSDVVLAAVSQDGCALQYAADTRRADKEIVLAAVAQNGRAFQCAAKHLKVDRDVVCAAVRQNGWMLAHAPEKLRADGDVVLIAAQQDVKTLNHAAPSVSDSREVLLACIDHDGRALRFASKRLRADTKVVLRAFSQRKRSLKYAEKPAALAVIKDRPHAFRFLSDELQRDQEIIDAAGRTS